SEAPKPGDRVVVGQLLAFLVGEGETAPSSCGKTAAPQGQASTEAGPLEPAAGPAARRLARSAGVELAEVAGSGPCGRVSAGDVHRHGQDDPSPASPARKAISPRARRSASALGVDWAGLAGTGRG